jgi:NAD(P)-dependent dehydrogenase (short-subunit alcohol dehydrogenase family)
MDQPRSEQTALIIGASRGLGLGLAKEYLKRGWRVVATARGSAQTGLHALAKQAGGKLEIATVDINEPAQIGALREHLEGRAFDLLFVNAGVANDPGETVGDISVEEFIHVMVTNALSPMRVIEAMLALVRPTGTIGVMSSGLGSVADNDSGGFEVYRASKAALNTLMRSFAARHATDPRTLLLIAPGWVRTDMGGPHADLSVEESINGVVDTISKQSGTVGLHYLDYRGHTIRW